MSRVILELSVSLDGYAAGSNLSPENPMGDDGERLHDWMFVDATDTGRRVREEMFGAAGAVIVGKRMFDLGRPYWDPDPETFQRLPVFVVTHRPAEPIVDPGGSTFTFISEGIERALGSAREAADDGDVVVLGGPTIGGQFLSAGLIDELRLHLVHILLGGVHRSSTRSMADSSGSKRRAPWTTPVSRTFPLRLRMTRPIERSRRCRT